MTFKNGSKLALFLLTTSGLCAQPLLDVRTPPGSEAFRAPDLQTNVDLVLVPVIVTNRAGATVSGLASTSFTVLEDNTPRPIVSLGREDVPASVGVIVDLSGSMGSKLGVATRAMRAFFDTANPEDEAFLLTVSSRPDTVSAFTSDFGLLQSGLLAARTGGATALIDTVYLGLHQMRAAHNKHKALLIISDGMDNHSRYSERELMRVAEESDVQIYTIGMAPSLANKKPIELTEERNGLAFLGHLAERTGGLSFTLASYEDPASVATKISRAIRDQYLIGYRPVESGEPGKWRKIQIRVSLPEVRVSSRIGYFVPKQ